MATLVRSIFAQPDVVAVWNQLHRVVRELEERFPEAAHLLDDVAPELLAFAQPPKEHWRQIWSNNPQERLNKDPPAHRRGRHLPGPAGVIRLVGAILAEQHDEWAVARRYMGLEALATTHARVVPGVGGGSPEEVMAIERAA